MDVDEIQPGRRAPMAEQSLLDMFKRERLAQQRIGAQINLPRRYIVPRTPVRVHFAQLFGR